MTDQQDDIDQRIAEARTEGKKAGYAQGYRAGQARKRGVITADQVRAKEAALRERAVLAALPTICTGTWTRGDKRISTPKDCVKMAFEIADEVVMQMRYYR